VARERVGDLDLRRVAFAADGSYGPVSEPTVTRKSSTRASAPSTTSFGRVTLTVVIAAVDGPPLWRCPPAPVVRPPETHRFCSAFASSTRPATPARSPVVEWQVEQFALK